MEEEEKEEEEKRRGRGLMEANFAGFVEDDLITSSPVFWELFLIYFYNFSPSISDSF